MKKIIAIVMALVMMMAITVPAFAGTLNSATQSGDTTVLVDGAATEGDGTYSVTIPAAINLTWGDTAKADDYEITSQLATNKRVKVTLAKSKDLTNANNETIAFTATDATDGISDAPVVTNEVHAFNLAIEADAWTTVSIAAYEGTISFAAELVDA